MDLQKTCSKGRDSGRSQDTPWAPRWSRNVAWVERGGGSKRARAVEPRVAQQLGRVHQDRRGDPVDVPAAHNRPAAGAALAAGVRHDRPLRGAPLVLDRPLGQGADAAVQEASQRGAQRERQRGLQEGHRRRGRGMGRRRARRQQRDHPSRPGVARDGDHLTRRVARHRLAPDRLRELEAGAKHARRRRTPVAVLVDQVAALHHLECRAHCSAGHAEALDRVRKEELAQRLMALGCDPGDQVSREVVEAERRDQRQRRRARLPSRDGRTSSR